METEEFHTEKYFEKQENVFEKESEGIVVEEQKIKSEQNFFRLKRNAIIFCSIFIMLGSISLFFYFKNVVELPSSTKEINEEKNIEGSSKNKEAKGESDQSTKSSSSSTASNSDKSEKLTRNSIPMFIPYHDRSSGGQKDDEEDSEEDIDEKRKKEETEGSLEISTVDEINDENNKLFEAGESGMTGIDLFDTIRVNRVENNLGSPRN